MSLRGLVFKFVSPAPPQRDHVIVFHCCTARVQYRNVPAPGYGSLPTNILY